MNLYCKQYNNKSIIHVSGRSTEHETTRREPYRVCPSESFHTGSMDTGLMAHSRMAKAKANSRALLHICTALLQFALKDRQTDTALYLILHCYSKQTLKLGIVSTESVTCGGGTYFCKRLTVINPAPCSPRFCTCESPSLGAETVLGCCSPAG